MDWTGEKCTSSRNVIIYYVETLSNVQLLSNSLNQDIAFLCNFKAINKERNLSYQDLSDDSLTTIPEKKKSHLSLTKKF